jgi:single-strand DNA-binding protein
LKQLNLDRRARRQVLSSASKSSSKIPVNGERPAKFMSFNKVIIIGNLGRDPELRYTPQGTPVCSFTVATNERRKDKTGEMQDSTTWFRVTLWGRQAETASQYLTKGRPIYVEGRLRLEEWTDRDGKQRFTLEVHATDMQFIGGGRGDEAGAPPPAGRATASEQPEAELSDDDIPF